jgi:C-terminal processing protease CtpA/Prc
MRKWLFLLLLLVPESAYCQLSDLPHISPDSIFRLIQQHSIYRKEANWDSLYKQFRQYTDTASNPYKVFSQLFARLGDHHSSVTHLGKKYRYPRPKPANKAAEYAYLLRHENYNTIRVKLLGQHYGYVAVPGVSLDGEEANDFIQTFRDSICHVFREPVKGWIIDLRTNGGGNTFPMMAILDFLLPDGPFATVRGPGNEVLEQWALRGGNTYQNDKPATRNGGGCRKKELQTPVVLLTSPITVSAGEMVPIAFEGRKNTITIGDTTGGLITSNEWMDLSEDTALNISNGFVADRTGKVHKMAIVPDSVLTTGYNLNELNKDKHVQRAMQWLNARQKKDTSGSSSGKSR